MDVGTMIKKNTVLLFMAAMGVVLTSYAFFFPTPTQMAQMGQQMIMPQAQICPPCDCLNK